MGFKSYIWDEQFDLNVALGRVRGASSIHKFGATPLQSNNTTATVWDKPDTLYPWTAFNTPGVLVAGQANASDDGKQVTIIGLDENWNEITEIFTLSSAATVSGTKTFKRVYRGYVSSGGQNIGNVSFNRDGTEVLRITAGLGQTLMSIYSVPAGYTAFLYQGTASTQVGADGTGFMYVRYTDETVFRVGHTFEVDGSGGQYFYKFAFPQRIPEKSDVDIRITSRSNNGRFTAAFDILLIKNEL
jgi:hypothetical protein